jgi:hypothetical protein
MEMVANWYKDFDTNPKSINKTTYNQIKKYEKLLKERSKINI